MAKFRIHAQLTALGGALPLGDHTQETDDEQYAKFLILSANLWTAPTPPVPEGLGGMGALLGVLTGAPESQAHVHLTDDEDENVSASTMLLFAAAITGEPFDVWEQRGRDFEAEHGEKWEGLAYNPETSTLSLTFDSDKAQLVKDAQATAEAEAASLDDDEAFEAWLADATAATPDRSTDGE
jgi:hypothetical protein